MTEPQNKPQAVKPELAGLDEVRIWGSLAVIIQHLFGALDTSTTSQPLHNWWAQNVTLLLFSWAVPVFVMISGAVLLAKPGNNTLAWYQKRWMRVGFPTLFWFSLYGLLFHFYRGDSLSVTALIHRALFGPFGHLHFLIILIGLYAITPLLWFLKQKLSLKEFLLITYLFLFLTIIIPGPTLSVNYFVPYIGFFMLGSALADQKMPTFPVLRGGLLLYYLCLCLGIAGWHYHNLLNPLSWSQLIYSAVVDKPGLFLVVTSPIVYVFLKEISLIRFVYPSSQTNPQLTKQLADLTFGVYLIHPLVLHTLLYGVSKMNSASLNWQLALVLLIPTYLVSNLFTYALTLNPSTRIIISGRN